MNTLHAVSQRLNIIDSLMVANPTLYARFYFIQSKALDGATKALCEDRDMKALTILDEGINDMRLVLANRLELTP